MYREFVVDAVLYVKKNPAIIVGAAIFASLYFGADVGPLSLVFVLDASGGGDDGGGDSGGGGGGDGSGCHGGCGADCGCEPGDDSTTTTSTPYLYLKKKDGVYEMQNDVMVGHPSSLYKDFDAGNIAYKKGGIGKDLYPVSLRDVDKKEGISFIIKEIEAEESYIDKIDVHTFNVPEHTQLMQDITRQKLVSVLIGDITNFKGSLHFNTLIDVSDRLNANAGYISEQGRLHSIRMHENDTLQFSITKKKDTDTHLILSSFWRDFIHGESPAYIHKLASFTKPVHSPFFRGAAKIGVTVTAFSAFFFGGGVHSSVSDNDMLAFMQKCNGVQVAHADTPHGGGAECEAGEAGQLVDRAPFVLSYSNEKAEAVEFAQVQSRVYRPRDVLISIPEEAFNTEGIATITLRSQKRHYLKNIQVVYGKAKEILPQETLTIVNAVHSRDGGVEKDLENNINYTHLVAGDTLELSTTAPTKKATHIGFSIHGFYTPLSKEGAALAGNWTKKLGTYEKNFIESIGYRVS